MSTPRNEESFIPHMKPVTPDVMQGKENNRVEASHIPRTITSHDCAERRVAKPSTWFLSSLRGPLASENPADPFKNATKQFVWWVLAAVRVSSL